MGIFKSFWPIKQFAFPKNPLAHKYRDGFKGVYGRSECKISKGRGNYEAFSDEKRLVCFLLKASFKSSRGKSMAMGG
jgi:hypothetical protein